MSQFGKASAKRSKPSYAYTIVGIALVLFLFGMVGWLFLNLNKVGQLWRENIQVHAWISPSASKRQIDTLQTYIASLPYVKSSEYIDKQKALEIYNANEDSSWKEFLTNNPLPESIDFYVKADHMEVDTLANLSNYLETNFTGVVSEFQFPKETVTHISSYTKYLTFGILAFAIIFSIIVTVSIDTTIRLAMYSNRFLIKTMQMVGATRNFIIKPLTIRALINGLVAGFIAILAILGFIGVAEYFIPWLKLLSDSRNMLLLGLGILVMGILISLLSTYRSVLKYLRLKLDDLY